MTYLKRKLYLPLVLLLVFSVASKAQDVVVLNPDSTDSFSKNYRITKHYDKPSNTYYYLTWINHLDQDGKLIKLRMELANKPMGETVRGFAIRKNAKLAFNASTMYKDIPNAIKPSGVQIIDGVIVQDTTAKAYTLGIKDNNELVAYKPYITAKKILADGAHTALRGFVPFIENHKPVDKSIFSVGRNILDVHPRQVIAQFDNLDILFLSCGGRGYEGDGMDLEALTRILMGLKVKFAFNLDGGGSVSTVIGDTLITPKIDKKGTMERLRPNFLYVLKN